VDSVSFSCSEVILCQIYVFCVTFAVCRLQVTRVYNRVCHLVCKVVDLRDFMVFRCLDAIFECLV